MIFTEPRFLFFFAVVFLLHWAIPRNGARKFVLLAASYAFYAAWDWRFLSLIVISTLTDYVIGRALERAQARRRWLLAASLVVNLGILGVFKYLGFFVESAVSFSAWLGLPLSQPALAIVLPVGISFYTFQTLSYTIDVYRGALRPTRSMADFALFVAFFPQLVAGPIVRAREFLPQLSGIRRFEDVAVRRYLLLFLAGFIKKACVADNISRVVDPVFQQPELYTALSKWLAAFLYSLQIYCDFSGYSDMAIACAGLLGFRLALNFDFPYLSGSIREFWRRWHISLSTWFRDYVYISLGGNRQGGARTLTNLWIVFLLCGLWHGANWTFVLWGVHHAVFLTLERWIDPKRWPRVLAHGYVLLVVSLGFCLFRAPDLGTAGLFFAGMFSAGPDAGSLQAIAAHWALLLIGFGAVHGVLARRSLDEMTARVPDWAFALGFGLAIALVLPWVAVGYKPFIYFQF